jgi:hypothetical protein
MILKDAGFCPLYSQCAVIMIYLVPARAGATMPVLCATCQAGSFLSASGAMMNLLCESRFEESALAKRLQNFVEICYLISIRLGLNTNMKHDKASSHTEYERNAIVFSRKQCL